MTSLHNGFALKQVADYYAKCQSALIEVLNEFVLARLLNRPLDESKWSRKVFKVYKTMNMLEKKKHTKPYFCKRMFKLIFTLYALRKGQTSEEIWHALQIRKENDELNDTAMLNVSHVSSQGDYDTQQASMIFSRDSNHPQHFRIKKYSREDKIDNKMMDAFSGGTLSNNQLDMFHPPSSSKSRSLEKYRQDSHSRDRVRRQSMDRAKEDTGYGNFTKTQNLPNYKQSTPAQQSVLDIQAAANAAAVAKVQTAYPPPKSGSSQLKQARPFSSGPRAGSPNGGSRPHFPNEGELSKANSGLQTQHPRSGAVGLERKRANRTRPISHYQLSHNQNKPLKALGVSRTGTQAGLWTGANAFSHKTLDHQANVKSRPQPDKVEPGFNTLKVNQDSGKDISYQGVSLKKRLSKKLLESGTLNQKEQSEKDPDVQSHQVLDQVKHAAALYHIKKTSDASVLNIDTQKNRRSHQNNLQNRYEMPLSQETPTATNDPTGFMSGVSIEQVRPIKVGPSTVIHSLLPQKNQQRQEYISRNPDLQDVNAHSRQVAKMKGKKPNSVRPYSSAVPRQPRVASASYGGPSPCRKVINYHSHGVKRPSAASAHSRVYIQHPSDAQSVPPRPPKRSAAAKLEAHSAAPINHISTNTVIIQINNQLVKLPQSQLQFVDGPGGQLDTASNSYQHVISAKSSEKNFKATKYQRVNRKIRLKAGEKKATAPSEQKQASTGQDKEGVAQTDERSARLKGGEKNQTTSTSLQPESRGNSAMLTRKVDDCSANQGIRESLPRLSSEQDKDRELLGSAVTIEAMQASQKIGIDEVGRQYVATSQPEMKLKPVLDDPRADVHENMVATPDVTDWKVPPQVEAPILISQTNLQSGCQLTHHIEVPAMHRQAIQSPTGISSIQMNPTSNQDSTYSFAAQADLGRVSGYQLDNLKEIVDQYEPPEKPKRMDKPRSQRSRDQTPQSRHSRKSKNSKSPVR